MMNHLTTMKVSQCFMILNVSPRMTWEDVKKSYHRLAKRYHPDLNPRNLAYENKFKELTSAFRILETHYKNPKRNRSQGGSAVFGGRSQSVATNDEASLITSEIIADPKANLSETPSTANEKKGVMNRWLQNLQNGCNRMERKIFLLDAQKNIRVAPHTAVNGGLIRLNNRKETFQVKIPPGSWNRLSLRVPDKGETSLIGKKRGDLILNIEVIQPEQLTADASRFFYELHVTREKIKSSKVQTLDSVQGPIKFVLPRGTRDGQTFVLKYQAKEDSGASPDHVVKVHLV